MGLAMAHGWVGKRIGAGIAALGDRLDPEQIARPALLVRVATFAFNITMGEPQPRSVSLALQLDLDARRSGG